MGSDHPKTAIPQNPITTCTLLSQSPTEKVYRSQNGQIYEVHRVQNYGSKDFLDKYQYRIRNCHQNLVNAYYIQDIKNNFGCNVDGIYDVVIDGVKTRLSQYGKLRSGEPVLVFKSVLKGYGQLYQWVGSFLVKNTMIGFGHDNVIKVWLNSNFALNSLQKQPPASSIVAQQQKQWIMISRLFQLIDQKTQKQEVWIDFKRWWSQTQPNNFKDAIILIQNYIESNRIKKSLVFVKAPDNKSSMYTASNNTQLRQSNVAKLTTQSHPDLSNSFVSNNRNLQQNRLTQSRPQIQSIHQSPPITSTNLSQSKNMGYANLRAKAINHQPFTQTQQGMVNKLSNSQQLKVGQGQSNLSNFYGISQSVNFNGHPFQMPQMPMILKTKEQKRIEGQQNRNMPYFGTGTLTNNVSHSLSLDARKHMVLNKTTSNLTFNGQPTLNQNTQIKNFQQQINPNLIQPPQLIQSVQFIQTPQSNHPRQTIPTNSERQAIHSFPQPRKAAQIIRNLKHHSPSKQQNSKVSMSPNIRIEEIVNKKQLIEKQSNQIKIEFNRPQVNKGKVGVEDSQNLSTSRREPGKIKHKTQQPGKQGPVPIQSNLTILRYPEKHQEHIIQDKITKQTPNTTPASQQPNQTFTPQIHNANPNPKQNPILDTPSFKSPTPQPQPQPLLNPNNPSSMLVKTEEQIQRSKHRVCSLQNNLTASMKMLQTIQKKMQMSRVSRMSRTSSDLVSSFSYKDLNNLLKSVRRTPNQ